MPRLLYACAAAADLADIYAYTLRTWGPRQADAYLARLRAGCESTVAGVPTATRLVHREDETFKLRCERHLIIFQRQPETVLIVRVLHERMDIDARLAEP